MESGSWRTPMSVLAAVGLRASRCRPRCPAGRGCARRRTRCAPRPPWAPWRSAGPRRRTPSWPSPCSSAGRAPRRRRTRSPVATSPLTPSTAMSPEEVCRSAPSPGRWAIDVARRRLRPPRSSRPAPGRRSPRGTRRSPITGQLAATCTREPLTSISGCGALQRAACCGRRSRTSRRRPSGSPSRRPFWDVDAAARRPAPGARGARCSRPCRRSRPRPGRRRSS